MNSLCCARLGGHRGQRAAEIVADLEQVAGKAGDGELARLLDLALRAGTQVLHLGQGAQQAVLELLNLLGRRRRGGVAGAGSAVELLRRFVGRVSIVGIAHRLVSVSGVPRSRLTTRAV